MSSNDTPAAATAESELPKDPPPTEMDTTSAETTEAEPAAATESAAAATESAAAPAATDEASAASKEPTVAEPEKASEPASDAAASAPVSSSEPEKAEPEKSETKSDPAPPSSTPAAEAASAPASEPAPAVSKPPPPPALTGPPSLVNMSRELQEMIFVQLVEDLGNIRSLLLTCKKLNEVVSESKKVWAAAAKRISNYVFTQSEIRYADRVVAVCIAELCVINYFDFRRPGYISPLTNLHATTMVNKKAACYEEKLLIARYIFISSSSWCMYASHIANLYYRYWDLRTNFIMGKHELYELNYYAGPVKAKPGCAPPHDYDPEDNFVTDFNAEYAVAVSGVEKRRPKFGRVFSANGLKPRKLDGSVNLGILEDISSDDLILWKRYLVIRTVDPRPHSREYVILLVYDSESDFEQREIAVPEDTVPITPSSSGKEF